MLKCDIATLAKLDLLKSIRNVDAKTLDQKYMTAINLEFANNIAEDYNIRLDDFIRYEKLD